MYDEHFSEHSHGFRPNRSASGAVAEALSYLNQGYERVIDLDIEKFFDKVNHDKLISIIRERVKDDVTLHLLRKILQAGVLEKGLVSPSEEGVPQGGLCEALHNPPYAKKNIMQSNSRKSNKIVIQ